MSTESTRKKIVIVGGGLVGTLNAVFFGLSERFDVLVCEKMSDIRKQDRKAGRSINLSLSHRGLSALGAIGLQNDILKSSIPMYARMVHEKNGQLKRIPYGKANQCICAVDRKLMNEMLITRAENTKNVQLRFNMKLIDVDFSKKIATFSCEDKIEEIEFDLLVGNDGAYSTVRQIMSKNMRLDFSQEYIPHGYIELYFPPKEDESFLLDSNCLHLWPRNEFMLICLPNPGGSFTGTLFMPFEMFSSIKTTDDLFEFFESNFPDALDMIGRSNLEKTFFANKPNRMVTIRCTPYNLGDSCIIMGDAAHAMVPFYGQGMNCGFEDLVIFHDILKANDYDLGKTCSDFTENRNQDAKAICELAFYNYVELRKNVISKSFMFRKKFDNIMNRIFPSFWIPLYTMVCFTRIPYSKCIEEKRKQDKILDIIGKLTLAITFSGLFLGTNVLMKSNWNLISYFNN